MSISQTNIADTFIGKTTFLVGNNKNAGKTTFLNYSLKQVRKKTSPAFLTIGIDGEKLDLIYGTPKPAILTEPGDYIVTSDQMINASDAKFEIHEVFPYKTALGRLVLARTLRSGFVELMGSEDNKQLSEIISHMNEVKNLKTIIVDGAANRTTQVPSAVNGSFIYIMKVTPSNLNSSIEQIKTISLLKNITVVNESKLGNNSFRINGALTSSKLTTIPDKCEELILEDFTKVFLKFPELNKLFNKTDIFFKDVLTLNFFVINLKDISRDAFITLLKKNNINEKILYNPYQI